MRLLLVLLLTLALGCVSATVKLADGTEVTTNVFGDGQLTTCASDEPDAPCVTATGGTISSVGASVFEWPFRAAVAAMTFFTPSALAVLPERSADPATRATAPPVAPAEE